MPDDKGVMTDSSVPERARAVSTVGQEPPAPRRVMSIHAHPDDQEFTVAGTLAKWARSGSEIISVCVTSGDSGIGDAANFDPAITPAYKLQVIPLREKEQLAANAELGVQKTEFLRYPDGELVVSLELRRDLARLIRKHKPDVVVCGDPTTRFFGDSYMNHPDHRVVADVAIDAIFPSAGTRLIFTELLREGLEPHKVKKVFMHGTEKPNTWIDISSSIEAKIAALRQHKSQIGDWDVDKEMRSWAEDEGKEKGIQYAEAFRVMVLAEDEADKKTAEVESQAEANA